MKNVSKHSGITLTELLVSVSIVVILLGSMLGFGKWVLLQSEVRLTESTIDVLDDALELYLESFYKDQEQRRYPSLDPVVLGRFPLVETLDLDGDGYNDDYDDATLLLDLRYYLDGYDGNPDSPSPASITQGSNFDPGNPGYSFASSEALYFFLNDYPDTAKVVGVLDERMISREDPDGVILRIEIPSILMQMQSVDLFRYVDAWGTAFLYSYDPTTDVFPVIRSAGPDQVYFTPDDIVNSE